MNVRKRLKKAYKNVTFFADRTWTNASNAYQNCNMELHLTIRAQNKKLYRYRPRNVRECIPDSRLAKYSNYVYNEARELSYPPSISSSDTNLPICSPSEPWEMPEVGELYKWFLKSQPEDDCSRAEANYESPLLEAKGFEETLLKTRLTEDRVKKIWKRSTHFGEPCLKSEKVVLNVYTSPMYNTVLDNNDSHCNRNWFQDASVSRDFDQLEQLSKTIQDQINSISKTLEGRNEPTAVTYEPASTEILYSEVLQGLSPSRKSKPDNPTDETSSISHESFTNYTVLSTQKSDECSKSNNYNHSKVHNKCVPQKNTTNVYFQNEQSYKYHEARPIMTSYPSQTYFYPPTPWIPPSCYPGQSWFTPNVYRNFGPTPVSASCDNNRSYGDCNRVEDTQIKEEGGDQFAEHPISTTISEDLESQALEQYNNSEFQDLERQAIEQYASSPE